jgi:Protein of unknown function (DUF1403)
MCAKRRSADGPIRHRSKLRGRDAVRMVEMMLTEDDQAAGAAAADCSRRRLLERLVSIGAARELTEYGLI